jgi:murein DD-endopeptidase MepM/ murein hydrolase activator NlpD
MSLTWGGIAFLLIVCIFSSPALGQDKAGDASPDVRLDLEYRALHPGEVIRVALASNHRIRQAHLKFSGQKSTFALDSASGDYLAFVGLDMGADPAVYPLVITVQLLDGTLRTLRRDIQVVAKNFPVNRLRVDQKFVTPPAEVQERIRLEAALMQIVYATYTPEWLGEGAFILPTSGRVNPNFGERRYFNDQLRSPHSGVDISSSAGTPVSASNSGRVLLADELYYAGNTVVIDHGLGVFSFYCHFSKLLVSKGDRVGKGSPIGEVGATGRVTGPHLHWSVRIRGSRVDPLSLLYLGSGPKR